MVQLKTMKNALLIILTLTISLVLACASDDESIIPGIGVRAHTAVLNDAGTDMYVFGGGTAGSFVNTIWTINISDVNNEWSLPLNPDPAPDPRAYHAAVQSGGMMYVIGGWNDNGGADGTYFGDMWEYNIAGNSWTDITVSVPAVAGHSAIFDGSNFIYVFGGFDGTDYVNDLWRCDLAGTCNPVGAADPPPARAFHAAAVNDTFTTMYIFGGEDGSTNLNDLWKFTLPNGPWELQTGASTEAPAVSYHTAVVVEPNLYVFGGRGNTTNAVWRYDPPTITYTSSSIQFVDGGTGNDSITDAGIDSVFDVDDVIVVSGSQDNDGTYTILSVTLNTIDVATGSLTTENSGNTVIITASGFESINAITFDGNNDPALNDVMTSSIDFTSAGFAEGDDIVVAGTASNNGTYTIKSFINNFTIEVAPESLTDETPTDPVTITENHWAARAIPDPSPAPRISHSAVFDGTKMYVFGGFAGALNVSYGDLWEYNPGPATIEWKPMESLPVP